MQLIDERVAVGDPDRVDSPTFNLAVSLP